MSLSTKLLQRLKRVNEKEELLTCGYIRYISMACIPYEIIQICIAFFMSVDEWDIKNKGKYLEISGIHNQIVECTNPDRYPGTNYQTVLGTLTVESGKHHWKFKITKIDLDKEAYWRIAIGIVKINAMNESDLRNVFESYLSAARNVYGVVVNNGDRTSWRISPDRAGGALGLFVQNVCCKNVGDTFDVWLDIDNKRLCVGMKGNNYGDVYDDTIKIEKTKYKIGMSLSRMGTAVELVCYEQIDQLPMTNIPRK